MVNVIRKNIIECDSKFDINGMFIFHSPNTPNGNNISLPIIYRTSIKDTYHINTQKNHIEVYAKELEVYFNEGDILEINSEKKFIKGILSSKGNENTLLLTEQCDNKCIFCSQPPNLLPDQHLYNRAIAALLNFSHDSLVGLTGGEPTINKKAFINLMSTLKLFQISTPLHILTNGRNLGNIHFFKKLLPYIDSKNIIWGVPIYGHKSSLHDSIVGSHGAFNDTINGLLNLASTSNTIEIRIVLVEQNYKYLNNILKFISNSFPTIRVISIMNLEPIGWAKSNYKNLHIPIKEQNQYLICSMQTFNHKRFNIKLMNYPLCLIDSSLRKDAIKSISDWKNYYPDECQDCTKKELCGGYFSSAYNKFIEKPKAFK